MQGLRLWEVTNKSEDMRVVETSTKRFIRAKQFKKRKIKPFLVQLAN